ncbi:MAG: YIP1 family protein [Candidatus Nanohaloarchaea archaeon]|nr:YIP1 family protein [Candidatus Nanohaloarchaea archaeon]
MEVLRIADTALLLRHPKRFFEEEAEKDSVVKTVQFFVVALIAGFLGGVSGSVLTAVRGTTAWMPFFALRSVARLSLLLAVFVVVNGTVIHGMMFFDKYSASYWKILEYPLDYEGTYRDTFAVFMYSSIVISIFAPFAAALGVYGIMIAPFSLLVSAYVAYIVLAGLSEMHEIKWIAELKKRWPAALLIDADIITLLLATLFLVFVEVSITPIAFGLREAASVGGVALVFLATFVIIEGGIEIF